MSILLTPLLLANIGTHDTIEFTHHTVEFTEITEMVSSEASISGEYVVTPFVFPMYLEEYKVEDKTIKVEINSQGGMNYFTNKLLNQLPKTAYITSKRYSVKQLKAMYERSMKAKDVEVTPTVHGLSNYSASVMLNKLVIHDHANDSYSAATIKKAVDRYVQDLAPILKGETELDTIQHVYDYMFHNYEYTANSYREMIVGNLGSGKMACNGFSYLADAIFEEVGITSEIRAGNSHFWNVLTLEDGSEITFDIATDLVLEEYKATLGASTKEHIEKTRSIGFYDAQYPSNKYHEVASVQIDQ